MADIINGTDLYVFLNDTLVAYSTAYTITVDADAREITNKGTGTMRTYKAGLLDVSASCDGLFAYGAGAEQIYDAMILRQPVKLEFGEKDTGDILNVTKEYYAGYFIITKFENSASDTENSTYSASFKHSSDFRKDVDIVYPYLVTYFVDATGGDDGNDGLTEATAWQTTANVHSTAFVPGDAVLFKRGETFRGSIYKSGENGTAVNRITYGAYGTGVKPKILGSKDLSANGDWTNDAGNVWKTTATLGTAQNDISNMVFNNEASWGIKQISKVACDAQGDFFYGLDDLLYMYSVGNPGTFYTHIEACGNYDINQGLFKWLNSSYITVENLDLRYSSAAGIELRSCEHCLIEHNDVSWIGGEYLDNDGIGLGRLGNGISLIININDVIVRYNHISQCYDEGIAPQGWGTYIQSNVNIYYNIIEKCWVSMSLFTRTGSTIDNIKFNNNVSIEPGTGWSDNQRPDLGEEAHFRNYLNTQPATNVEIRNNIFYGGKTFGMYLWAQSGFTITNNIYYDIPTDAWYRSTPYTLAQFQAATGFDADSFDADPLFISTTNFHLQAGSPAINEGVNVGLTRDYDNVLVSDPPEIGVYEY